LPELFWQERHDSPRGAKATTPVAVSTAPSMIPPFTGTQPTTSPVTHIGTVTTSVAKQPFRNKGAIIKERDMTIRIGLI